VLSVPLLDLSLALCTIAPLRKFFVKGDMVFIDSYRQARYSTHVVLQALPHIVLAVALLALSCSNQSNMSNSMFDQGQTGSNGNRMLLQYQQQVRPLPDYASGSPGDLADVMIGLLSAVAATVNRDGSSSTIAPVAAVAPTATSSSSSRSGIPVLVRVLPTVPVPSPVAVVPLLTQSNTAGMVLQPSSTPAPLNATAAGGIATAAAATATAAIGRIPQALIVLVLVFSALSSLQKIVQLFYEAAAVKVKPARHLANIFRLQGGVWVPRTMAVQALDKMLAGGPGKLRFTDMGLWDGIDPTHPGGRSATRMFYNKLPLVPRYLFPPDGSWLAPGQMSNIALTMFDCYSPLTTRSITTWEVEHSGGDDLAGLLQHGLQQLQHLKVLRLSWCHLEGR
jgi:hypothetical protein